MVSEKGYIPATLKLIPSMDTVEVMSSSVDWPTDICVTVSEAFDVSLYSTSWVPVQSDVDAVDMPWVVGDRVV